MDRMYDEATARELLRVAGTLDDMVKVDSRGIWPDRGISYLDESARELMRWKPAMVLRDRDDAPDIFNTPALPFPFTASQLAAFMAHGIGVLIADAFGDWADGPDADAIAMIDVEHNYAARAIVEAYAMYRRAKAEVMQAKGVGPSLEKLVLHLLDEESVQKSSEKACSDKPAAENGPEDVVLPSEERQDHRLRVYRTAGYKPPTREGGRWQGVGQVAAQLHISRQTLTEDLKKAWNREREAARNGLIFAPNGLCHR